MFWLVPEVFSSQVLSEFVTCLEKTPFFFFSLLQLILFIAFVWLLVDEVPLDNLVIFRVFSLI